MNDTQKRITELESSLNSRQPWLIAIESTAYFAILLLAFLSNFLLCLTVYKTGALRNNQVYYLVSLAVTDISFAVLCMPPTFVVLVKGTWLFGDLVCEMQGVLVLLLSTVSLFTVAMMAVNRYVKMVKSAGFYNKLFSKRNILISIAMSWTIATVSIIPSVFISGCAFNFHPGKCLCFLRVTVEERLRMFVMVSFSFVAFAVFPTVVFSYYKVFRKIRTHFVQVGNSALLDDNAKAFAEETKIAKMLFATCFTFFVCWIPSFVVDLYEAFRDQYSLPRVVYIINIFTFASSSAVNPLIYGLMRREFRDAYKKTLACKNV